MRIILILIFALSPIFCNAQSMQELADSISAIEDQINALKSKLGYGEDKSTAQICIGEETYNCNLKRAYYDDYYLCVEVQFCSNSKAYLQLESGDIFCIVAENFIKRSVDHPLDNPIKLQPNVPQIVKLYFYIHGNKWDGSGKPPRLIEYLKIVPKDIDDSFIFRNISIETK